MSPEYLSQLGVLYRHCPSVSDIDRIASERSYKNRDEITVSPENMGALYEEKVHMFFNEHLHEDEEIRYILEGNGFFDVRNDQDKWVRIRLEAKDLIVSFPFIASTGPSIKVISDLIALTIPGLSPLSMCS